MRDVVSIFQRHRRSGTSTTPLARVSDATSLLHRQQSKRAASESIGSNSATWLGSWSNDGSHYHQSELAGSSQDTYHHYNPEMESMSSTLHPQTSATDSTDLDEMLQVLTPDQIRDMLSSMNMTEAEHAQYTCRLLELHENEQQSSGWCGPLWDSIMCWPPTPPNTSAILSCFSEFNGIKYDTTQNATKWCHQNGTWDVTDYMACQNAASADHTDSEANAELIYIYFTGYAVSLLALTVAITIFVMFKDLRCLRNTIHANLMFAYVMADFMWMLTFTLQTSVHTDMTSCVVLIVLLNYFQLTNFFWMFVEGLYLYMLVVETFYAENMKWKIYASIGWGGPVVFVISWAVARSFTSTPDPSHLVYSPEETIHCPWMISHQLDWIYQTPTLVALAANFIFLLMIMWVLITKLRSANTVETQQYRKATKALLVLIPLLGTTYILVIVGPTEGLSGNIYNSLRAVLLSTQGFTVALFYCFLNTEVQNTLRHRFERWKESRSIEGGRRYRYHSKDWSPRSRTESIRLCVHPTNKRESTVSETTTTTLVSGIGANGGRVFNGSGNTGGGAITRMPILQATPPGSD